MSWISQVVEPRFPVFSCLDLLLGFRHQRVQFAGRAGQRFIPPPIILEFFQDNRRDGILIGVQQLAIMSAVT